MGYKSEIKEAVQWDAPSVSLEDSLRTVIQKMVASKVSALTVKAGTEVVGVVTDMDVMVYVDKKKDLDATKVSSFMTSCELISREGSGKIPCVQLDEKETVENALGVMTLAGVHNLLVSGEGGTGMVSVRDLLGLLVD